MIEVMFGDSEAAAMKIALKSGKGFGNDVVCLGFMLDIGNIRKPVDGEYRSEMLRKLLYREQWGVDDKMQTELSALGKKYSHELCRLRSCLANGEQIRIWYSSAPYSMCGLLWLCGELRVPLAGASKDGGEPAHYRPGQNPWGFSHASTNAWPEAGR